MDTRCARPGRCWRARVGRALAGSSEPTVHEPLDGATPGTLGLAHRGGSALASAGADTAPAPVLLVGRCDVNGMAAQGQFRFSQFHCPPSVLVCRLHLLAGGAGIAAVAQWRSAPSKAVDRAGEQYMPPAYLPASVLHHHHHHHHGEISSCSSAFTLAAMAAVDAAAPIAIHSRPPPGLTLPSLGTAARPAPLAARAHGDHDDATAPARAAPATRVRGNYRYSREQLLALANSPLAHAPPGADKIYRTVLGGGDGQLPAAISRSPHPDGIDGLSQSLAGLATSPPSGDTYAYSTSPFARHFRPPRRMSHSGDLARSPPAHGGHRKPHHGGHRHTGPDSRTRTQRGFVIGSLPDSSAQGDWKVVSSHHAHGGHPRRDGSGSSPPSHGAKIASSPVTKLGSSPMGRRAFRHTASSVHAPEAPKVRGSAAELAPVSRDRKARRNDSTAKDSGSDDASRPVMSNPYAVLQDEVNDEEQQIEDEQPRAMFDMDL